MIPSAMTRPKAVLLGLSKKRSFSMPSKLLFSRFGSRIVWDADRRVTLVTIKLVQTYLCVNTLAEVMVERMSEDREWNEVHNVCGPLRGLYASIDLFAAMVTEQTGQTVNLWREPGPPTRAPILAAARFEDDFGVLRHPEDRTVFGEMIEYQKQRHTA